MLARSSRLGDARSALHTQISALWGRSYSERASKPSIGFIGLGQMGYPMASNLFKALSDTHAVTVFDPKLAPTPRDVASSSDFVLTMLPGPAQVRSVYMDPESGITAGFKHRKGSVLLVDWSTIDAKTAVEVAGTAEAKGKEAGLNVKCLDAPVSGGTLKRQRRDGRCCSRDLTFMIGGPDQETFDRAKPFLEHMGKKLYYCGKPGSGQIVKMANNMLLGISMIGAAEAMNLGIRNGVDASLLASIINTSSGRCWSTDTYNPVPGVMKNVPSDRGYEGGFGVKLIVKDLGLAVAAAHESKSTVAIGAMALQLYCQIASGEFGDKDFSVVFKWLNDNSQRYQ
ncbi:3-hydroxyisobutyrate dehydrogenase mitochondrial precursor [Cladochytrium replicatum]|nr:3-hydroxyisobutyrate dehydrogenase mitochondrial precursor [Cladochytrium replicatum]